MNNKRIIAGIMAFCLMGGFMSSVDMIDNAVITAGAVDEAEYTEGTYELLTYRNYGDHIEITDCDESATEVVIPTEIDGVPVTSIKKQVFSACSGLTSINVSEDNENYSDSNGILFNKNKTELIIYPSGKTETEYIVPDSVVSIGDGAFAGCSGLTSIKIPDSVISIGNNAFSICSNLALINIPDNVTSIGEYAFSGCSNLKSIEIPDSVTNIEECAFYFCSGLTSINIPNSITSIENSVFYSCSGLTSIKIPEGVTSIGDYAFYGCSGLTSIKIPDSVTNIGSNTFEECSNLKSINISNSVTNIGYSAFKGCSDLTSVNIPDSITIIRAYAFSDCSNLTSITILNPECEILNTASTISNGCDENDEPYFNGTIYGYDNSTAQSYAEFYGCKFESLGEAPVKESALGDVDRDGIIDASDASLVLAEYALLATGDSGSFTENMKKSADINNDGQIDSVDSSLILSYYAYTSTGGTDTIEKFLETSE